MIDLEKGLVAWYPLKGNTEDVSGNQNHGVIKGSPIYVVNHLGEKNGALDFAPKKDNICICDSDSLKLKTNLTISAWIKPRCLHFSRIINKWEGHTSEVGAAYNLGTDRGNAIWFEVCDSKQKPKSVIARVNIRKFVMEWHHIAGTYDGSLLRLFIDGKQKEKKEYSEVINQNSIPLYIGTGDREKLTFNGAISDVRIYNRALDNSEIKALACL